MGVTYKHLGDGCTYTLAPLRDGAGEVLTLEASRKREPVRSGLIVDADQPYPLGFPVELDIRFPGQEGSYRARCIVSWVGDPQGDKVPLGVTITRMDKYDPFGIRIAPPSRRKRRKAPEAPQPDPVAPYAAAEEATVMVSPDTDALHATQDTDAERIDAAELLGDLEEGASWPPPPDDSGDAGGDEDEFGLRESVLFGDSEPDANAPPVTIGDLLAQRRASHPPHGADAPGPGAEDAEIVGASKEVPEIPAAAEEAVAPQSPHPAAVPEESEPEPAAAAPPEVASAPAAPPVSSQTGGSTTPEWDELEILHAMERFVAMLPQDAFDETVFVDEVFLVGKSAPPGAVRQLLAQRQAVQVDVFDEATPLGGMRVGCAPPCRPLSMTHLEQGLLRHTTRILRVIRAHEPFPVVCVARVAAASTALKAAVAVDAGLLHLLCQGLAFEEERRSTAASSALDRDVDPERGDVTGRIEVVVPYHNQMRRTAVPARLSQVPPPPKAASSPPESRLSEVFLAAEALFGAADARDAAGRALAIVRDFVSCSGAACALLAPEKKFALQVVAALPEEEASDVTVPANRGLAKVAMERGKVVRSRDGSGVSGLPVAAAQSASAVLCAPVSTEHIAIGVLELYAEGPDGGFSEEDAEIAGYVGAALGSFISSSLPDHDQ